MTLVGGLLVDLESFLESLVTEHQLDLIVPFLAGGGLLAVIAAESNFHAGNLDRRVGV